MRSQRPSGSSNSNRPIPLPTTDSPPRLYHADRHPITSPTRFGATTNPRPPLTDLDRTFWVLLSLDRRQIVHINVTYSLNHLIVFGRRHTISVLKRYLEYDHGSRTHLGLEKDTPYGRPIEPPDPGPVRREAMVLRSPEEVHTSFRVKSSARVGSPFGSRRPDGVLRRHSSSCSLPRRGFHRNARKPLRRTHPYRVARFPSHTSESGTVVNRSHPFSVIEKESSACTVPVHRRPAHPCGRSPHSRTYRARIRYQNRVRKVDDPRATERR
jgi:hypothetical protein